LGLNTNDLRTEGRKEGAKTKNPKSEARNPKQIRITKIQKFQKLELRKIRSYVEKSTPYAFCESKNRGLQNEKIKEL